MRRIDARVWVAIVTSTCFGFQTNIVGQVARVNDFPGLPSVIARDLSTRGCLIPQANGLAGRHNVIRGEFRRRGQQDWAVLCLRHNTSVILIYADDKSPGPTQLGPMDETLTESKRAYYRIIGTATPEFVRAHYDASARDVDPMPTILDHDGIDDGIFEKGSTVHYYYRGKWLKLAGAD